jgi:dTDP-4-amino-4,6-dideoxygalactose transaminase
MATQSRDPAPHYEHSELGFNYRLSNISAAIGCGQLLVLEQRIEARKTIFANYRDAFASLPQIEMMPVVETGNFWLTAITINSSCAVTPKDIATALSEADIETRPIWKPMNLQPFWKDYQFYSKDISAAVCDDLFWRGICLPSGSALSPIDQERIISIVKKVVTS